MKGITFEAGGKVQTLRFDINALCALEDETGLGLDQVGLLLQPADGTPPRLKNLRLMFWAGLGGDMPKAAAGAIMSHLGVQAAADLIVRAFVDAFPEAAAAPEGDAAGNGAGAAAS